MMQGGSVSFVKTEVTVSVTGAFVGAVLLVGAGAHAAVSSSATMIVSPSESSGAGSFSAPGSVLRQLVS